MLKKLIGAAAMAAATCAFVPAHAAHVMAMGCSPENLAKAEGAVEVMVDVPGKFIAQREIAAAQAALLTDNWGGCAMHLTRAIQAENMGQAPYGSPYTNTLAQSPAPYQQGPYQPQGGPAPYQAQGGPSPYQSQWGWGAGQGGWGPGPSPE